MRSLKLTAMLPLLMALPALAQNAQLEANKMLAQKFFQSFGNPAQLKELMHPDYIQHHPVLKAYAEANHLSGRDAFFKFMESGGFGPPSRRRRWQEEAGRSPAVSDRLNYGGRRSGHGRPQVHREGPQNRRTL